MMLFLNIIPARLLGWLIQDYKDKIIYDLCIQSHSKILVNDDSEFNVLKKFKRPEIIMMSTTEFLESV